MKYIFIATLPSEVQLTIPVEAPSEDKAWKYFHFQEQYLVDELYYSPRDFIRVKLVKDE